MKRNHQTDDADNYTYPCFEETQFAPLSVRTETGIPMSVTAIPESPLLDGMLAAIKWLFLYVPGAAAIHILLIGFALSFFYKEWPVEMMIGTMGTVGVSSFMIMLGVGKLRDLKYLRVVVGILATSALSAMLFSVLIAFIPGDFLGSFFRLTLPLSIFVGYLVKRDTDKNAARYREQDGN